MYDESSLLRSEDRYIAIERLEHPSTKVALEELERELDLS